MSPVKAPTGPSSMCRNDEHALCATVKARCNCTCHGRTPQMPPERAERATRRDTDDRPRPVRPVPVPVPRPANLAGVVFEPPPHFGRKPSKVELAPQLDVVRSRPGEWARIQTFTAKSSAATKAKKLKDNPPDGRWEFKGCAIDGGSGLWARYLGE